MSLLSGNRGRKLYKLEDKNILIFLRFNVWSFMHHCHWFCLLHTRDHKNVNKLKAPSWESGYEAFSS